MSARVIEIEVEIERSVGRHGASSCGPPFKLLQRQVDAGEAARRLTHPRSALALYCSLAARISWARRMRSSTRRTTTSAGSQRPRRRSGARMRARRRARAPLSAKAAAVAPVPLRHLHQWDRRPLRSQARVPPAGSDSPLPFGSKRGTLSARRQSAAAVCELLSVLILAVLRQRRWDCGSRRHWDRQLRLRQSLCGVRI